MLLDGQKGYLDIFACISVHFYIERLFLILQLLCTVVEITERKIVHNFFFHRWKLVCTIFSRTEEVVVNPAVFARSLTTTTTTGARQGVVTRIGKNHNGLTMLNIIKHSTRRRGLY